MLNGCGQINKTFSSYRSHIYRKHRDLLSLVSKGEAGDNEINNSEENIDDEFEEDFSSTDIVDVIPTAESLEQKIYFKT